jgi:CDGSH-type Zn-finger protein
VSAGITYVLPLRWTDDAALEELTGYLGWLSGHAAVIVVDGSPDDLFARHAAAWAGLVRHVAPDPRLDFANGKVNGVTTGLWLATHERVIVADDDVRYDETALAEMVALLDRADLVRPQNYFASLPWHAHWDTARTLLNRSLGADYPGTFGLRRSMFRAMGGYKGDVLFENLELVRTVRVHGGTEVRAPSLFVRRLPPSARRFWSQRVRQAYDDLAQPWRHGLFLMLLPVLAVLVAAIGWWVAGAAALAGIALAELGRRRAHGTTVFFAVSDLFAPVWIVERAICSWLALGCRLCLGGVRYAGRRIPVAAHSERALKARARAADAATITPYPDGPLLVRGNFTLAMQDGTLIDPGRRTVALCRCGKSVLKPFCDGTHKAAAFRAGNSAVSPQAADSE